MKIEGARAFWDAYQIGQGSADHTDFEVFAEVIQPLIDYARAQSAEGALYENALERIADRTNSIEEAAWVANNALARTAHDRQEKTDE